jgi:hypothetical protein
MLCAGSDWRRPSFYRVELFQAVELLAIEFFDSHELEQAKRRVITSVASGSADRGAVLDDAGGVVFAHPAAT